MYRSNIYLDLRLRHIKNVVAKHSYIALFALVFWSLWFAQQVYAVAKMPVVINYLH